MYGHKMLDKIEESAKSMKVPDTLKPEQMQQQLNSHMQKKKRFNIKAAVTAACLCLCFGGAVYALNSSSSLSSARQEISGSQAPAESKSENQAAQSSPAADDKDTASADSSSLARRKPVKKIGSMYTLASDYGEVYDVLKKNTYQKTRYYDSIEKDAASSSGAIFTENSVMYGAESGFDTPGAAIDAAVKKTDEESSTNYSSTNLQVLGVDESDIVKTDGRYIYVVQEAQVQVLDVQNKIPKKAGTITPVMDEDTDKICEMYAADNTLTLILQSEIVSMEQKQKKPKAMETDVPEDITGTESEIDVPEDITSASSDVEDIYHVKDIYSFHAAALTKVVTYDITNPEKPVLQDTATQDGWYKTSRKIGNFLYLFTDQSMYPAVDITRKEAVTEDNTGRWIPCVNEKAVSADCIYLPEKGNQGLIISSFDLASHCSVLDTKLLISDYTELYVSQTSAYLYYTDYINSAEKTRIARFALESDGGIQAGSAASLKGCIQDTFAIHERDGYLQVLTSVFSSDPWENRVYVLDETMEVVGKLTGLAKGEEIYSARFVGTTGYFVTYRNTDPLFTVDFSDPKQPKVIGELKVTGFSEYLHFWSDDRLLGIGYETNPDSGETMGVKLSMFDISNPSKVTEEARLVLEDADGCAGMYNYKAVLVDLQKNIIALTTESYKNHYQEDYRVFSYDNGQFASMLKRRVSGKNVYQDDYNWRSLYVDDTLYLVNGKKTIAFDMKNWKEIGKVSYKE